MLHKPARRLGLAEADVGGDLANVKTRAERKGDRVIVNGAKRWTSGAAMADYIYALVRTGPTGTNVMDLVLVVVGWEDARPRD